MVLISNLESGPYWKHMNMSTEVTPDGETLVVMKITNDLLQFYGNAHGGVIAGLMDTCIAVALNQQLDPSQGASTIEMKLNYVRPVNKGTIRGRGKVIQQGKNIIVGQGEIFNEEGKLVAFGTATFVAYDMK